MRAPLLWALYTKMKMDIYLLVNISVLVLLTGGTLSVIVCLLKMNLILKIMSFIVLFFVWGFAMERGITKYTNMFVSKYLLKEYD